jgi:hypothetical protein
MRTRTILATLAVFVAGAALSLAADANMGTWKLNEAKSKIAPGSPKNTTVTYAAMGDSVKVTVDGVDKDGKPTHNEWSGKFDGKEYAVTGDPTSDMRSYSKVDDHTTNIVVKKDGKTTVTGNLVLAADGKSRTLTTTSTDAAGKTVTNTFVYDKQ